MSDDSKAVDVISRVEKLPQTQSQSGNQEIQSVTPEQAKVNAIADLTQSAYQKASSLALTDDEKKKLRADFTDEAFKRGANGNDNMIYIEHAFLRDRLNEVVGVGQWALICRSRWAEEFSYEGKIDPKTQVKPVEHATRIYVEAMLVIRGCYVGEAIGDMVYYKSNQTQNYGDAVEGAKTGALRRCCKELGIGLQPWKKDFVQGWKERNPITYGATPKKQPAPAAGDKAAPATPEPTTNRGGYDWRNEVIPVGNSKGTKLGDAPEKTLKYFVSNYRVQTEYVNAAGQRVRCSQQSMDTKKRFRLAMDACSEEMGI
jgi:hypothetical protein